MDIKEILLAGGSVSFSYKEKVNEWVGTAKINAFSGGMGMSPCINVEIPCTDIKGRKEFNHANIDEAVSLFNNLVFREKNLCYKMAESMVELHNQGQDLDLDIPKDLAIVRELQNKKQNETLKK